MKRFNKYLILCFIMLLCLCGCNNKKDIKQDDKKEESKFVDLDNLGSGIKKYDLKCDEIKDIIDYSFYDSLFITGDGKLYQISFNKIFSNEKNCKQIDSSNTFKKFIRGGIVDSQNDVYYFDDDKGLKKYNFETGFTTMPASLKTIDKNDYINIFSAISLNSGNIPIYFYVRENKVYKYDDTNSNLSLNNNPIFELKDNEVIENYFDDTIKTNKSFYVYSNKVKNKEECNKYADVKCISEDGFYEVNKKISSQYNNIKFYKSNGYSDIVVDKNNNVYTNVLGG